MATAKNTAELAFGTPTQTWAVPTHYSVHRVNADNSTTYIRSGPALNNGQALDAPIANQRVVAPAEMIIITIPDEQPSTTTGLEDGAMLEIIRHYFDTGFAHQVRLHDAAPGTNGTANELNTTDEPGYARAIIAAGGWTLAA